MWWENKGKARVIGNKVRKNKRRLQRSNKLLPILTAAATLTTLYLFLHGASRTLFSSSSTSNSNPFSPSNSNLNPNPNPSSTLTTRCTFDGPLPGALEDPLQPKLGLGSLTLAQNACLMHQKCTGVVYIPWQRDGARYELRAGTRRSGSLDGQMSYLLESCDRAAVDTGDGRTDEELEQIRQAPIVFSEDMSDSFWKPDALAGEGSALESRHPSIGSFDPQGNPTIFIGIASYRDAMCEGTVTRALENAKYPSRLFFGIVDQMGEGDPPCLRTQKVCRDDPGQVLCKYSKQMRKMFADAADAKGPTWGRHRADSLYRGEYFAMQIDAHMYFVKDWDQDIVHQWFKTGNEMAVLSTYPSDLSDGYSVAENSIDKNGMSKVDTTPVMCRTKFVGNQQMLKHDPAVEIDPREDGLPILHVWWAAGISFSRGHRIVRVPYDCCLPMLFDGEEASMAARMWTHGYDFYTFHHSAVFHTYTRKKAPPLFWENENKFPHAEDQAEQRVRHLFMLPTSFEFDRSNLDRYRLGNTRTLEQFLHIVGVDFKNRKIRDNCVAVENFHFHDALTPFCCEGFNGIDYTRVPDDIVLNNFKPAADRARQREELSQGLRKLSTD